MAAVTFCGGRRGQPWLAEPKKYTLVWVQFRTPNVLSYGASPESVEARNLFERKGLDGFHAITGSVRIRSRHSVGPISCTLPPAASTATVTGISDTVNS